jgi:hypothetical protein
MDDSDQICASCGKQNPANARFCYACGASLAAEENTANQSMGSGAPEPGTGDSFDEAAPPVPEPSYVQTQPHYTQPAPQGVPPAPAPQGYPPVGYPPAYPQQVFPTSKPPRRGRGRCCAVGCLVVLLVLLIGLPILHVTVLRPLIEKEIYKQVQNALEDVGQGQSSYYGIDTETITERKFNDDAEDVWLFIPGSSEGHIYLQQDQIKLEVKIYGVKVWAAADVRVNNRGEFLVKSIKMHWLLNAVFSQDGLKREIVNYANDKIIRPKGLNMLAFQVSDGKLFVAYEGR